MIIFDKQNTIMEEESRIFEVAPAKSREESSFHSFKLLRTTGYATLSLAVKEGKRFIIKTTKDNSAQHARMLRREYELSIGCDHPNIVHIYTYEKQLPQGEGIVMEYIEGRTLDQYLNEKPGKRERRRIFGELLSAVGYLHNRGIMHNDLKPGNILVTRTDNTLKLIDFGLADSDAEYAMRTLGCSPRYASPELRERSGTIDARSDIYSIGLIMESLLGSSSVSRRCTKSDPGKRYANISELQRAFKRQQMRPFAAALMALFLIYLIPFGLYISQSAEQEKENALRKEQLDNISSGLERRDSLRKELIKEVEQATIRICEEEQSSIAAAPYSEFATMHLVLMQKRCGTASQEIASKSDDPELQAALLTRSSQIYMQYYNETVERINSLPIYFGSVGNEEAAFYDSLILHKQPYRPYLQP